MIYLSVSAIRDYMACPKRYWWRIVQRAPSVINEYVRKGQIVHGAIEKCSNLEDAIKFVNEAYQFDFLPDSITQDVEKMIKNYYEKIEPHLGVRDKNLIESNFKIKWNDNAYIVGKIDRMSTDRTRIYDWKTSYKEPSISALQDPQFYIYHWAITTLYKREPEVYYGHLLSGKLFRVDIQEKMWYNVKYLIEQVLKDIEGRTYYPRVAGYQCESCFFKGPCWTEFRNELDS